MTQCIICGVDHDRLRDGVDPAMYCERCAEIRKDATGTVQRIMGTIYLGDAVAAETFDGYKLCVHEDLWAGYTPTYHVPILVRSPPTALDRDAEASTAALEYCAGLIEGHLDSAKRLLVHCHGGVERSPLTVAYWLVRVGRYQALAEAYRYLKGLRPVIADRTSWLTELPRPYLADGTAPAADAR